MIRNFYAYPEIVSGYPVLDGCFSILIPEAATNLCTNPSFELATTGYTALNGAIARDSTYQRRGIYSLKITPNAGAEAGVQFSLALTAGKWYAFSVDLRGEAGKTYNLYVADTSNNRLSFLKKVTGKGYWERVPVVYYENTGATRRFYLTRSSYADTNPFYTDGWQIVNSDHDTTYVDGDLKGFLRGQVDFGWTGTPHASTSIRTNQTFAGGREMNLKDLGFTVLSVLGLGLGAIANIATANVDGGSFYQQSVRKDRSFTIAGAIAGTNLPELMRNRKALQSALDNFKTARTQPMVIRCRLQDDCGNQIAETVDVRGVYNSGLGGVYDNEFQENVGLTFDSYFPLILNEGEQGMALSYQQSVADADYIAMRDTTGLWQALGTGAGPTAGGSVESIVPLSNGKIVVGGFFPNMGGVANTANLAVWDPVSKTWAALGTGTNGTVRTIAVAPDGTIYIGGDFTLAGGVANTAKIAKWTGAAFAPLSTGITGITVASIAISPIGKVFVGGSFSAAGGVADTVDIAMWDPGGSAWSALGTGTDGYGINSLAFGNDSNLYAGGGFTQVDGVTANGAAKWNTTTSTWTALGSGAASSASVTKIIQGPDGYLYIAGSFTTFNGVPCEHIARWNGVTALPLGSGLNDTAGALAFDASGLLYVGGIFTTAGGLTLPDHAAIWNGSSFVYPDIKFPGTAQISALTVLSTGEMFVGFDTTGTATAAYVNTVNNAGSAAAYPVIIFTGPGTVYSIRNVTTKQAIYFNLTLNPGEIATLDLDPNNPTFTSNFRGNIRNAILRGSNMDLFLQPGDNLISVLVAGTTSANTAVAIRYRAVHVSLDSIIQ